MITVTALMMTEKNNTQIMWTKPFSARLLFSQDIQSGGTVNHRSRAQLQCHQIPTLECSCTTILVFQPFLSNPTLIQRTLIFFPSIVAYLCVWYSSERLGNFNLKKSLGAVVSGCVHIAQRSLLH